MLVVVAADVALCYEQSYTCMMQTALHAHGCWLASTYSQLLHCLNQTARTVALFQVAVTRQCFCRSPACQSATSIPLLALLTCCLLSPELPLLLLLCMLMLLLTLLSMKKQCWRPSSCRNRQRKV
jgi:hypothetical protein